MKKNFIILLLISVCRTGFAQQEQTESKSPVVYIFFANALPDGFNFPHIGLVNSAAGSHKTLQMGLANHNQKDLSGLQMGLMNHTGAAMHGAQMGLANYTGGTMRGVQMGLLNIASTGMQAGLVNISAQSFKGLQLGLANLTVKNVDRVQVSPSLNIAGDSVQGSQVSGMVNIAGSSVRGSQVAGLVNIAGGNVGGAQVGVFLNIADSSAYPIGFVNIINKGKMALALTIDENRTLLLSFRSGGTYTYGIVGIGYNFTPISGYTTELGFGAYLVDKKRWGMNLEATGTSIFDFDDVFKASLRLMPVFKITKHIELLAGITFNYMLGTREAIKAVLPYSLWQRSIGSFYHAAYIGLSFNW
jgi:uncharacterized protein YjbI with pentapeptide repeats